jgi:hypothetical protein
VTRYNYSENKYNSIVTLHYNVRSNMFRPFRPSWIVIWQLTRHRIPRYVFSSSSFCLMFILQFSLQSCPLNYQPCEFRLHQSPINIPAITESPSPDTPGLSYSNSTMDSSPETRTTFEENDIFGDNLLQPWLRASRHYLMETAEMSRSVRMPHMPL